MMSPTGVLIGDALQELKKLPDECVQMCVTSPPYWQLRDYKIEGQLGREDTPEEYVNKLCDIFDELKRVLKSDGACFVVIDDTYGTQSGSMKSGDFGPKNTNNQKMTKPMMRHKSLLLIPDRFAIEMFNRGWYVRNEIIWWTPNVMPDPTDDRFTVDFEKIFFFTKNPDYYFEQQLEPYTSPLNRYGGDTLKADGEDTWADGTGQKIYRKRDMRPNPKGRNKRCVWAINTEPIQDRGVHFAAFPYALPAACIKAGSRPGDLVADIFCGTGTTLQAAKQLGRKYLGIDINPAYLPLIERRLQQEQLGLA